MTVLAPNLTRRSALGLAAGAALASRAARADTKPVYLLTWGGTIQAMLERDGWAKKFNAATGYDVILVPKATGTEIMATAIAQKARPQVDVVQSDLLPWLAGIDQDLYAPIDQAAVPHLAELYPQALVHDRAGKTDPGRRALWRRVHPDLEQGRLRPEGLGRRPPNGPTSSGPNSKASSCCRPAPPPTASTS